MPFQGSVTGQLRAFHQTAVSFFLVSIDSSLKRPLILFWINITLNLTFVMIHQDQRAVTVHTYSGRIAQKGTSTRTLLLSCCSLAWGAAMFAPAVLMPAALMSVEASAEDWTRFRGPNGTGVSNEKGFPVEWSESDYEWVVPIEGTGHSSPVIYGASLFLTSGEEDGTRNLICLDSATGEKRWVEKIKLGKNHLHKKNSYCSSSPTVDSERVYIAEADTEHYLVNAYTHDGKKVWSRDLGPYLSQHGFGPSPVLYNGLLIVANNQDGPSHILALDAATGETRWTSDRESDVASYSTPMIINLNGKDQLIVLNGATGLAGLDPQTGKELWASGKLPQRTVASPVYGNNLLVATCGSGGRGKFMVVVDPSAPSQNRPLVHTERTKLLPYVPTPLIKDQYLYLWNDDGTVCCVDMQGDLTDTVWKERIGGNFSGSPIMIDGKIYCISEEGKVRVIEASPTFKSYAGGSIPDSSHSTPAVANGRLYLKGFNRLACLKSQVPVASTPAASEGTVVSKLSR